MNKLFALLFLSCLPLTMMASTTTAVSNGSWNEPAAWTNGSPGCFDTIVIPAGITITVTQSVNLNACPSTYINIYGTLHFQSGKKLDLSCGSVVYIQPGGGLTGGGGGGNSNWIKICNTAYWTAGDGNLSGPAVLCEACSLPIELLYFSAELDESRREVELKWSTASEGDNDFFTVERSENGTEWQEVLEVGGAGNSSIQLNYSAFDQSPILNGQSYYRLKQTDFNGQYSYSPIVGIAVNNSAETLVYPNPVKMGNDFVLVFPDQEGLVEVTIYAMDGQIVYSSSLNLRESTQWILSTDGVFEKGVYMIRTQFGISRLVVE